MAVRTLEHDDCPSTHLKQPVIQTQHSWIHIVNFYNPLPHFDMKDLKQVMEQAGMSVMVVILIFTTCGERQQWIHAGGIMGRWDIVCLVNKFQTLVKRG